MWQSDTNELHNEKARHKNQRTNGPVNGHLRSGIYTNKLV